MSIKIACPECDAIQRVKDELAGRRVGCKKCGHRFLVKLPRDSNPDDEDDRRPGSAKRSTKQAGGIPVWVWLAGGGGIAFIGLLLVIAVVLVVLRSNHRAPGNRPEAKRPDQQVMPGPGENRMPDAGAAAPGPHVAIVQEFASSWNAAANAVSQARDQGSVASAISVLRQESSKMDQLTQRLRTAGRVANADVTRVTQIQQQLVPATDRFPGEVRQLEQRLPGMRLPQNTLVELENAVKGFGNSTKNFVSVAKQNLP